MRIPFRDPLPPPTIFPKSAATLSGALEALTNFITTPPRNGLPDSTAVLSGAGISVPSGLADYRGAKGTYRLNKAYRPIYFHEFMSSHASRQRYWARSFLGWPTLFNASPNGGHHAIRELGEMGLVGSVVTQNVDSFHPVAHPLLPTLELHGYLRATVCMSCREEFPRDVFQDELARLNPAWTLFLADAIARGVLDTHGPTKDSTKRLRTNPDGDVDLPDAPYTTFRYPPCPRCLAESPRLARTQGLTLEVDEDGAWKSGSNAGILKPAVVMFGENIAPRVKVAAEEAITRAGRLLVLGTSLATASAWTLARKAKDIGMPVAIINIGGVRGEEQFRAGLHDDQNGHQGVRAELSTDILLPALVDQLKKSSTSNTQDAALRGRDGSTLFKDMLS